MSQTFIEEVSRVVVLRPKGRTGMLGLCPFHRERTPSFYINLKNQTFHCFGCGVEGTREEFAVRLAERSGFVGVADIVVPPRGTSWGPWQLHSDTFELSGPYDYRVDLDECRHSAEVLDWIVQIAKKDWATDEVLAHLIRALDALFDLQKTMCSHGVDSQINPRAVEKFTRD